MRALLTFVLTLALFLGCAQDRTQRMPTGETAASPVNLGLRPDGETEIQPDVSQISDELQQVFDHIDENFRRARHESAAVDPAAEHLEYWRGHPRVRANGEGPLR